MIDFFFVSIASGRLLLVHQLKMLHIDSLLHLNSLLYRWLLKVLPCAKLTDCAGLLEFPLESLESSLYVLTFFYRYYDHLLYHPLFACFSFLAGAKVLKLFSFQKKPLKKLQIDIKYYEIIYYFC